MDNKSVKLIDIAGFKVTLHAVILLVTSWIFALALLFLIPQPFGAMFSLGALVTGAFASYNVNCVQVGHCKVWAMIILVVYITQVVFVIYKLFSKRNSFNFAQEYYNSQSPKSPFKKGKFTKR